MATRKKAPPQTQKIIINTKCGTNPPIARIQIGEKIQWQAPNGTYFLRLPGNDVFKGQPIPFYIPISGAGWQPPEAFAPVANKNAHLVDYVEDFDGIACIDTPPEIIIGSGLKKPKKNTKAL